MMYIEFSRRKISIRYSLVTRLMSSHLGTTEVTAFQDMLHIVLSISMSPSSSSEDIRRMMEMCISSFSSAHSLCIASESSHELGEINRGTIC